MDTRKIREIDVKEMKDKLDLYGLIEDMAQNTDMENQNKRLKDIDDVVQTTCRGDKQTNIYRVADKENRKGETVLHTAIKRLQFRTKAEKNVLKLLIREFPAMLSRDRRNTEYAGQTPLHMAVTKGSEWVTEKLLEMSPESEKSKALKCLAVGPIFVNTVMMAELPLSIAAVTGNHNIFDLLIEHGADLVGTNRHGDNVCHSLIRYALLYPEKSEDVLNMCKHINKDQKRKDNTINAMQNRKLRKKIWLMENKAGYTPLQLAAKFGQHEIFKYIMNLDVYCYENVNDGLFDIKIYDVTEIDAISHLTTKERTGFEPPRSQITIEDVPARPVVSDLTETCQMSTLQMLLQLEPGCAFQFLLFPPLRRIIDKKWAMYRWYLYPWFLFHVLYMCFLVWYGIERSAQVVNSADGYDIYKNPVFKRNMFNDGFGLAYGVINCFVGTLYMVEAFIRLIRGRMRWTFRSVTNPYGNGTFQIMFVLFALLLILDFPLALWVSSYENYLLLISIILGWFLILFFLRALRPFSFFTVMIQKVLFGDLFRFSVILLCELIGFSTAMYMVIQGSPEIDSEFDGFGRVLVSMFKLMVGLGEMGIFYQTRHPVLVILIFMSFIIMTTILMINSLIAMLSRTCTELVDNVGGISSRDMNWKLQRLSVVLYIESILPECAVKCVGKRRQMLRYNTQMDKRNTVTRYMMEIRSLQNEDTDNTEDTISDTWGFQTTPLNALLHGQALRIKGPLSGFREAATKIVHRRRKKPKLTPVETLYDTRMPNVEEQDFKMLKAEEQTQMKKDTSAGSESEKLEKLEIYNRNRCHQCSADESIV